MIRLELPIPPSANNLFLNPPRPRMRRPVSPIYTRWQWEARAALPKPLPEAIKGPYRLRLLLPMNMRGDVDNRLKAASDFLVSFALIPNDRHALSVMAERSVEVRAGWSIVEVEAA